MDGDELDPLYMQDKVEFYDASRKVVPNLTWERYCEAWEEMQEKKRRDSLH